jgi:hypothetical protein
VQGHVSCLQMARDKYVELSDGRQLKVYERADGSEYHNEGGERKTLRSNQRTSLGELEISAVEQMRLCEEVQQRQVVRSPNSEHFSGPSPSLQLGGSFQHLALYSAANNCVRPEMWKDFEYVCQIC